MNSDRPTPYSGQIPADLPAADAAANTLLWNRVRNGQQEALVLLYERLYFYLVNYGIRICGDIEITKDAINDLFLEIWDQRHKQPEVANVKSYLLTWLRRRIFADIHHSKKTTEAAGAWSDTATPHELSYEECIVAIQTSDEIKQKIRRAMAALTPRQKELIQLRYFDGLSMEEVSQRTGISTKTVYNTLGSALKCLSAELSLLVILLWMLSK
ncbi:RNA polymerase sigma-70 factor (ECF subfamily) [Chitinophaga polysaccharea]|uniref:RNA polymerase sigma-70 factor (ECF subfamily) n=1 Tax=Chitinophaga polysaccharea TaxID=1293035 RepID=A0A561Q4S3_9BACT|nr:sigma-70 family RNA polymerase sigma factor [Chitinophaga polysaccharea]TWF45348.1 RNA polymerase sigma-70 factor (ECF subfamily) [Chitinophaga polysaccharea]